MNLKKIFLTLGLLAGLPASLALGSAAYAQTAPAPAAPPVAPPVAPPTMSAPSMSAPTMAPTAPAAPDASASPAAPAAATPDASAPDASAPDASATPAAAAPDATAAATPPVAPAATPDDATTTVSNPYGLGALWDSGDFVARGTLLILVIMSMASWYVLITKGIQQSRMLREARAISGNYWQTHSVRNAAATLKPGSAYQFIAQSGVDSLADHTGLLDKIDIATFSESAVQDGVDIIQSKMQEGLALLGTVGSTAPFVGLFGTVWGIYHALTAIGIAGQASIDKVAGPVGEALIMTAIGLAVAVPAVLGYNFLVRRNKRVMDLTRRFAKKVLFVLLTNDAAPGQV